LDAVRVRVRVSIVGVPQMGGTPGRAPPAEPEPSGSSLGPRHFIWLDRAAVCTQRLALIITTAAHLATYTASCRLCSSKASRVGVFGTAAS